MHTNLMRSKSAQIKLWLCFFILPIMLTPISGFSNEPNFESIPSPQPILEAYLNDLIHGRYRSAYGYVSKQDQKNKSLMDYLKENPKDSSPLHRILVNQSSFKVISLKYDAQTAEARVEHSVPNFESAVPEILTALFGSVLGNRDEKKIEQILEKQFSHGIPLKIEQKSYQMRREAEAWKIVANWKNPQQRRTLYDDQLLADNRVQWRSEQTIDEMTDEKLAVLTTGTIRTKNIAPLPYTLKIRCQSTATQADISLFWGKSAQPSNNDTIQIRFDRDKMFEMSAQTNPENSTSYFQNRTDKAKLIKLMLSKKILRIKHPTSEIGRFSLVGFKSAYQNACAQSAQ